MRRRLWCELPLRVCRWLNGCTLCVEKITAGQRYRDGGYNRRAHEECAPQRCGGCNGSGKAPPAFPRFHPYPCGICDGAGEVGGRRS